MGYNRSIYDVVEIKTSNKITLSLINCIEMNMDESNELRGKKILTSEYLFNRV